VEEVIQGALSSSEAARFESAMKPLVDAGEGVMQSAFAFVRAVKH
jgi:hypothetical protein